MTDQPHFLATPTVVDCYQPLPHTATDYQSEAALEQTFIQQLVAQGYERLNIHHEADLIANLRTQLEALNDYHFSNDEWQRFFNDHIVGLSAGITEKTSTIQEDCVKNLRRDDGSTKNITLIDQ